jgi:hypothetical protein
MPAELVSARILLDDCHVGVVIVLDDLRSREPSMYNVWRKGAV